VEVERDLSGLTQKVGNTVEDSVCRHERQVEVHGRCRNPKVGVVTALSQGMTNLMAARTKVCTPTCEFTSRPDDAGIVDEIRKSTAPSRSPVGRYRAVLELHHSLKADDETTANEDWSKRAARSRVPARKRAPKTLVSTTIGPRLAELTG
jgi:hypothetical protein